MPEQSPDQPANTEPAAGNAVRVTTVPASKLPKQPELQPNPASGLEPKLPSPVPAVERLSGNGPSKYHWAVGDCGVSGSASHQAVVSLGGSPVWVYSKK